MAAKVVNSGGSRAKDQDDPAAVDMLVRKLVAHAEHAAPPRTSPPAGGVDNADDDVLFDYEVDGVRCVLARSHHGPSDALALSPREREVARMIAKGYPNKIVASVLDISVWTVSTHLRRIFAKLGVTSRAAMVTRILKNGKI